MASTAYMRIEGYKSTSPGADLAHRGWVLLDSVLIGKRAGTGSPAPEGLTRQRGETLDEDVLLVRELDSDSPQLATECKAGTTLRDVVLEMSGTMKGSGKPGSVRCTISQAVVVRHRIRRQSKGKGGAKGQVKDPIGTESFLLRCAKMTFQQS